MGYIFFETENLCVCMLSCFSPVRLFSDRTDYSPPSSSVRGILQARILKWVAISSFRGSSQTSDWTHVSCVSCIAGRQILYPLSNLGSFIYIYMCVCVCVFIYIYIYIYIYSFEVWCMCVSGHYIYTVLHLQGDLLFARCVPCTLGALSLWSVCVNLMAHDLNS